MYREEIQRQVLPRQQTLTEGQQITARAARYVPETIANPSQAVLFIPGWAMEGNALPLQRIGRAFAKESNQQTFILSTNSKSAHETLYPEAEAMESFLHQHGIKNVTLVGHSEGALKALTLACRLQNTNTTNPIHVDGMVLMNPLGFSHYTSQELVSRLLKAAFISIPTHTLGQIRRHPREWKNFFYAASTGASMVKTLTKRAFVEGPFPHYTRHIRREIATMIKPIKQEDYFTFPTVIALGCYDNVIVDEQVMQDAPSHFSNAHIIGIEKYGHHGMPYQQYDYIAQKAISLLNQPVSL